MQHTEETKEKIRQSVIARHIRNGTFTGKYRSGRRIGTRPRGPAKTAEELKALSVIYVSRRRRKIKQQAVDYKGGKCQQCGYDKCVGALDFHHRDPSEKDFSIAALGNCRAWEVVKKELDKCDLLCANCHREVHHMQEVV